MKWGFISFLLLFPVVFFAQQTDKASILSAILYQNYKNEKPVYKGRGSQYLFLYCDKTNNNEEIFETVNAMKLPAETVKQLRQSVAKDVTAETWSTELETILALDKTNLKIKINDCLSLEQYQERRARLNLNNQRLMIIYKPLFYDNGNHALVKIVFYRSIEHNSGSVLLMEKTPTGWLIKDNLNPWST
ncbi:hypothetical protein [Flavobacterium silvaticum]|uniref:DUF3828 domain-containing protein n=1 Tax=Flavobacterium silvaticum TaxID=1852020 RepID=A0A972G2P6_9FLAO|nr:hypothetical protein [Flavobacterium silvaticum]NMH29376.1 hypothetical protein [Flavobacterium silvaticum]